MSNETIENKLAELERRMEAVENKTQEPKPAGAWKELFGWAKNDDLHRAAAHLGAEWRQQMNEQGR